jgi:DNA-binding beta-propeller fold protein YncE
VLKLSARSHRVLASARVDANPGDLVLSPDGSLLAVTHFDLRRITDFDMGRVPSPDARLLLLSPSTLEQVAAVTVCPAPHGVAFSRDGKRVFVACYSDEVAVVDLAAGNAVTRVKVAANAGGPMNAVYQPYGLAVSSATGDVFISALAAGEVRVLRGDSLTIDEARTARVGGNPIMMGFNADASRLYVPHQGDDAISEVDPATGKTLRLLQVPRAACTSVHQAWVVPGGKALLVVCEGNHVQPGTLVTLALDSGETVGVTPVGVFPDFVGLLPAAPAGGP